MALIDEADVLLHTGSHKTGSTSIQKALSVTADMLRTSEPPTLYPQTGRGQGGHFALGHHFTHRPKANSAQIFQSFTDEVNAFAGKCLISAETFDMSEPDVVAAAFGTAFPDRRIGIVRYVRPFPERLISRWNQRFKSTWSALDFEPFVMKAKPRGLGQAVDSWDAAFPGRFWLLPFTKDALRHGDVVRDFFERVFGDAHPALKCLAHLPRSNESKNVGSLLVLERAKPHVAAGFSEAGVVPHPKNKNVIAFMLSRIDAAVPVSSARLRLSHKMIKRLADRSRPLAQHIDKRYFDRPYFEEALDKGLAASPKGTKLLTAEEALGLSAAEVERVVEDVSKQAIAFFREKPELAVRSGGDRTLEE